MRRKEWQGAVVGTLPQRNKLGRRGTDGMNGAISDVDFSIFLLCLFAFSGKIKDYSYGLCDQRESGK